MRYRMRYRIRYHDSDVEVFLGCRRKTYDIGIRYGGRSKKTLFGNFDIEVLTFDIEEKTSISLYDIV